MITKDSKGEEVFLSQNSPTEQPRPSRSGGNIGKDRVPLPIGRERGGKIPAAVAQRAMVGILFRRFPSPSIELKNLSKKKKYVLSEWWGYNFVRFFGGPRDDEGGYG